MIYETDRKWSDGFTPAIKKIVGAYLLEESSYEVDTQQAADLVVLNGRDKTIACRVRRCGYADKFGNDFTIRLKRDSGAKTEMEKIVDGFGDWLFYGHADTDGMNISRWMLINLPALRAAIIRKKIKYLKKSNGDGTHFLAFDIRDLPASCLIAASFIVEYEVSAA
jgi:hypothetical protein